MKTVIFTEDFLEKHSKKNPQDFAGLFEAIGKSDLSVIFLGKDVHSCCQRITSARIRKLKSYAVVGWQPRPEKTSLSSEDVIYALQSIKFPHYDTVLISSIESDFPAADAAHVNFILVSDDETLISERKYPVRRLYKIMKDLELV